MNLKNKWGLAIMIGAAGLLASCSKDGSDEQSYMLNTSLSKATWKGYKRDSTFNVGTIAVESRNLRVMDGVVSSGSFEMPLATLQNLNLPTEELKEMLIHHLKTADFFNMVLYPSLNFNITSVVPYTNGPDSTVAGANYTVSGDFTMLGKSLPLSFPAKIAVNSGTIAVDAILTIDRTDWGMTYATSDTLAADQAIREKVDIALHVIGDRQQH